LELIIRSHDNLAPEEIIAELYARVLDFAGETAQQGYDQENNCGAHS